MLWKLISTRALIRSITVIIYVYINPLRPFFSWIQNSDLICFGWLWQQPSFYLKTTTLLLSEEWIIWIDKLSHAISMMDRAGCQRSTEIVLLCRRSTEMGYFVEYHMKNRGRGLQFYSYRLEFPKLPFQFFPYFLVNNFLTDHTCDIQNPRSANRNLRWS